MELVYRRDEMSHRILEQILTEGGRFGGLHVNDTSNYEGRWGVIVVRSATVVSSITGSITNFPTSLEPGEIFMGSFTQLQLTSGAVILYNDGSDV